ncbi:hypothetical protein K402DRAFT_42950 [Aulographum hederae CBS 113979]|uniref:Uncharacterized protein n=1 Tax=Aulographum hederae CBS 113979 TaxID=1176131 RepID=A0A6G1H345_9PEZI|nr:hypothetical protein K402DRAFT_42950 [Aulographum hederae CBS 113979]
MLLYRNGVFVPGLTFCPPRTPPAGFRTFHIRFSLTSPFLAIVLLRWLCSGELFPDNTLKPTEIINELWDMIKIAAQLGDAKLFNQCVPHLIQFGNDVHGNLADILHETLSVIGHVQDHPLRRVVAKTIAMELLGPTDAQTPRDERRYLETFSQHLRLLPEMIQQVERAGQPDSDAQEQYYMQGGANT